MRRFSVSDFNRLASATYVFATLALSGTGHAFASPEPIGLTAGTIQLASGSGSESATQPPALQEKPLWSDLNPEQRQALAPLSGEWDAMDESQKKEWLAISSRYASLNPDQQFRLQQRMRDWVKLSPDQRRVARESYTHSKKLDPDQKASEWQQYQQLTEEQKKKLVEESRTKKRITNLPSATQETEKLTPPAKSMRNLNPRQ